MLYRLDRNNPANSPRITIQTPNSVGIVEKDIEEFLANHLFELVAEDKLMLIGQERRMQEEADLLAIDSRGCLYIFEIKRWEAYAENLLQVMRYGQKFGRYSYQQLEGLAHRHQKLEGSLSEKHKDHFGLETPVPEERFNFDQRFVVVTNGVDHDTFEAIRFWKAKGLKIDCVIYKIYEIGGDAYIQFDTYNPEFETQGEESLGFYIVNTNSTYMEHAWRDMLGNGREGKAAAYYDRKNAVSRIARGSIVYLYHTGTGIVAKGKATADCKVKDHNDDSGQEYYVPVKFDWFLPDQAHWESAPKAWEINSRMDTGHKFRQTVIEISKEMADEIDKIWLERRETI